MAGRFWYWVEVLEIWWQNGVQVPWTDKVNGVAPLLALVVSLVTLRLQIRTAKEQPSLSATAETFQLDGKTRVRLRVKIVNRGPVPFTVNTLGLDKGNGRDVFSSQWKTKCTPLPVQLTQGAEATVEYYDDVIGLHPAAGRAKTVIAALSSGKCVSSKLQNRKLWTSLLRRGVSTDNLVGPGTQR